MSRLINPGAGDVADRFTVVALKVLFGEAAGKDVGHFRNEQVVLLTKLNTREVGPWLGQLVELGTVNAALWHAEDDLRDLRGPDPELTVETLRAKATHDGLAKVAHLAFRIQGLNDHRARLVADINKAAGDGTAAEKLT